jgi:N,N'-diacetyllegionaminate synthase
MSVFIIAEAGVNHNGKLDLALRLCDVAKRAGVDAVKFQTFKTDKILTKTVSLADYQSENIKQEKSQFEMIRELELSYFDFEKIKQYCDQIGILFLSTPDEEDSLDFLVDRLKLVLVKVGSGEVTNIPYLRAIGKKKLPVILSTGMSTLAEVALAYNELLAAGAAHVDLLHCTTNYPCPMDEVNLNAMLTLRDAFKCVVGYSDHTLGIEVSIAAVALGAQIIEKHFTLDKSLPGPDHVASLDEQELTAMVKSIRNIEMSFGNGIKAPNASEIKISKVVRRNIVAATNIVKGESYNNLNLLVKRSGGDGIPAIYWDLVLNHRAPRDYVADELVEL